MPFQPWATSWKACQATFPFQRCQLCGKIRQNWRMLGCRSGHIGQLRAKPLPECCRSRPVSTEDFNLTPIGGRNDTNCHCPLGKQPKSGKIDMAPKWAGPYGRGPGHLKFLFNIDRSCSRVVKVFCHASVCVRLPERATGLTSTPDQTLMPRPMYQRRFETLIRRSKAKAK